METNNDSRARWAGQGGGALAVLAAAHFVIDAYSSGYAPMLVVLRDQFGLTLAQVGGCAAVFTFSSSLMQPLYGLASDRLRTTMMIALAPAVTALGLATVPLTNTYLTALACFFVAGIGIAAFHPQGAAQATESLPRRPSLAMSLFIAAGNLGFALGPTLVGLALAAWSWPGLWRMLFPGALATVLLVRLAPPPRPRERHRDTGVAKALRPLWKPLTMLYLLVVIRGVVQLIYVGFLPLYFIESGLSLGQASGALTVFLTAGSLGGFAGGFFGDRYGGRTVIRFSMVGSLPFFVAAFFVSSNAWQLAALCFGYFVLLLTMPINVIMAQSWVPDHPSTVSSLLMGFAWGVGGIVAPIVGKGADLFGLERALLVVGMMPLLGIWLAWRLPERP